MDCHLHFEGDADGCVEIDDILIASARNRLLDEAKIPTRRQLRSDTSKQRSPIRKLSPDVRSQDVLRKAAKLQRDGSRSRKSRANTPGEIDERGADQAAQNLSMQRSTSKGSQTDLPAGDTAVLNEIIEETFEHATQPRQEAVDQALPAGASAREEAKASLV